MIAFLKTNLILFLTWSIFTTNTVQGYRLGSNNITTIAAYPLVDQQTNRISNSTEAENHVQPQSKIANSASFTIPITVLQAQQVSQNPRANNTAPRNVQQDISASHDQREENFDSSDVLQSILSSQDSRVTNSASGTVQQNTSPFEDREEANFDQKDILEALLSSQNSGASESAMEAIQQDTPAPQGREEVNSAPTEFLQSLSSPQNSRVTNNATATAQQDILKSQDQGGANSDPREFLQAFLSSQDSKATSTEPSLYQEGNDENSSNSDTETSPTIMTSCGSVNSEDSSSPCFSLNQDNSSICDSATPDDSQNDIVHSDSGSQINIQLNQVTVSQILYHMNDQYEKMNSQEDNNVDSYKALQMFFTKMLRVSEKITVKDNKDIVSTTYAAYYSTEYAYTFALCKLHHITGGPQDSQHKIDPKISSLCVQMVEKFTSLSVLYKNVVSQSIKSGQVLQYNNDENASDEEDASDDENALDDENTPDDENAWDDGTSTNDCSASSPQDKKTLISNEEILQSSELEKSLNGYNDDKFYSRLRTERKEVDQYDNKIHQQKGNYKFTQETKGQETHFSSLMSSEIRSFAGNDNANNLHDEQNILKKADNQISTNEEAVTKGREENDAFVSDSTQKTEHNKTNRKLREFSRNYFDDDNDDIGGNIKNAKLQEVEIHQNSTMEHLHDENEQIIRYQNQDEKNEKYTFGEAVQKLVLYIQTLHEFTSNMETDVKDKNNSSDGQGKDIYTVMYSSVYEKTIIYRRYLRKYFTNLNVQNGTFNGTSDVDSQEVEINSLQLSIQRYLWLQSAQSQDQSDSQSKSDVSSNPLKLLWYFENFYYMQSQKTQTNVSFMRYIPYPDFGVTTNPNNSNGVDIQFYLNDS